MIGFCSLALRTHSVEEAVDEIAAAGFRQIELWYPHVRGKTKAELCGLMDHAKARGVGFSVLSPYFTFTRGAEKTEESLRVAAELLDVARSLGISKIRTFVDIGPDGLPSERATAKDWTEACRGLKRLCALDRSSEFVVETHENTLADSLSSVQRLLAEVSEPNLKLNFQANRDFFQLGFEHCLEVLWPHVSHMHWQQTLETGHEGYLEESGLIDFARLVDLLESRGYGGTASVEYCWANVDRARIPSATKFLRSMGARF